jgi:predicted nucleic-acid-binding protein
MCETSLTLPGVQRRADFADYLNERCAHAAECQFTLTFDPRAATVPGMRLLR